MRLGTRVWSVGKFFLLVGALGATFLISFGVSMRVALRAREVEVPVLVGLTVNEATETLATLGLGLRVDDNRRADPKVPLGRVMQQSTGVPIRRRRWGGRTLGRHADSLVVSAAMITWLEVAVLIQRLQWPRCSGPRYPDCRSDRSMIIAWQAAATMPRHS